METTVPKEEPEEGQSISTVNDEVRRDRIERFEDLGFTSKEAGRLADATVTDKVNTKLGPKLFRSPLPVSRVRKALESPECGHKRALYLFAED